MSTDKTALGDLKIVLVIIFCITLIWGFFRIRGKSTNSNPSAPKAEIKK